MVQLVGPPGRSGRYKGRYASRSGGTPVQRATVRSQRQSVPSRRPVASTDALRPIRSSREVRNNRPQRQIRYQQQPAQPSPYHERSSYTNDAVSWLKRLFSNKLALSGSLMAISLVMATAILVWPRKTLSQTELEFFRQQMATIRDNSLEVKKYNDQSIVEAALPGNIDTYNEALLNGLVACEAIDTHVDMTSEEVMKPYVESINQVRLFCDDYEDVVDYARKISKATKQLLTYDTRRLTDRQNETSLTDTMEILGYTRVDVDELKGLPAQDPANEEMLIMIDNLLKEGDAASKDDSWNSIRAYAENTQKLQTNFMTARKYYWTNTVNIDAMLRSINRLHDLFQEEK